MDFEIFRELDADVYEKFHRLLVTYLSKCAIFLVGGLKNFGGDLVSKFYVATLTEYENSSMKDQIYKVNNIDILSYVILHCRVIF